MGFRFFYDIIYSREQRHSERQKQDNCINISNKDPHTCTQTHTHTRQQTQQTPQHTHTHTYTNTHTHTHTHTHIHTGLYANVFPKEVFRGGSMVVYFPLLLFF